MLQGKGRQLYELRLRPLKEPIQVVVEYMSRSGRLYRYTEKVISGGSRR